MLNYITFTAHASVDEGMKDETTSTGNDLINVKENGEWVQKPYYSVEEKLPYGHGEKSVYIINGFIRLTREEALAINWHMGGFDSRFQGGGGSGLSESYRRFPLSVWLHVADLTSTYIDENSLLKK